MSFVVINAPRHGFMLQLSAILIKLQWYSSGQMYVEHILGASCVVLGTVIRHNIRIQRDSQGQLPNYS